MQLFNLQCCRFLPFIFRLVRCITPDPSGYDDNHDPQSVVALLDGTNNLIAASENALKMGEEGGQVSPINRLSDTNAPSPLLVATDQTADACPLPATNEYSQRRRFRRGNACTAPLQVKPGARTETKPRPGNNEGTSKTPGNRISPHGGPLFESAPSWKTPKLLPINPEICPHPIINTPVCASPILEMTNWFLWQDQIIFVELPECYSCMFQPLPTSLLYFSAGWDFKILALFCINEGYDYKIYSLDMFLPMGRNYLLI